MEALREIYSNSITVHLPNLFAKQVEVIILPVEDQPAKVTTEDPWAGVHQIREQLERSGRTFSDSAELIRDDRR